MLTITQVLIAVPIAALIMYLIYNSTNWFHIKSWEKKLYSKKSIAVKIFSNKAIILYSIKDGLILEYQECSKYGISKTEKTKTFPHSQEDEALDTFYQWVVEYL